MPKQYIHCRALAPTSPGRRRLLANRERHDQEPVAADAEWEEAGHASHQEDNRETERKRRDQETVAADEECEEAGQASH